MIKKIYGLFCLLFVFGLLSACAPEVGSEAWCKEMDKKSKLDWSARELRDYTKHCLDK